MPRDVQDRLDGFDTTGVGGINITQFTEQLDKAILSFDIAAQIEQLMNLSDIFRSNVSLFGRAWVHECMHI